MKRILHIALLTLVGSLPALAQDAPTPDQMWARILELQRTTSPMSPAFNADPTSMAARLETLINTADEFWQRFPDNPHVWEAKLTVLTTRLNLAQVQGKEPDLRTVESDVREIADATTAPIFVRSEAGYVLLQLRAGQLLAKPDVAALPEFDKQIADFLARFPQSPQASQAPWLRLEVYEKTDKAKTEALLKQLATDHNPRIAAEAKRRLMAIELTKKPLDLKFTAVDGKEIDLAKMRGKVVLVDFWATWCGPCRMEMPNVVATYKKLHDKGFEIVGISLDSNKEKLLSYTKEKDITWPQYFDGKTWENKISTGFGISSIPTMWLVDKKGYVRYTEARADLETNINKLLTE